MEATPKHEEKKIKKQLGKLQHQFEWFGAGCKGLRRFNEPRNREREEARLVGRWQSGDCEGGEEAVGEG